MLGGIVYVFCRYIWWLFMVCM